MGIAAYNRGTKAVRKQIDREMPSYLSHIIEKLNNIPKNEDAFDVFAPTVIRRDDSFWYMMNNQEDGWASRSYQYASLSNLLREWKIVVTGYGNDAHSFFYRAEPASDNRFSPFRADGRY